MASGCRRTRSRIPRQLGCRAARNAGLIQSRCKPGPARPCKALELHETQPRMCRSECPGGAYRFNCHICVLYAGVSRFGIPLPAPRLNKTRISCSANFGVETTLGRVIPARAQKHLFQLRWPAPTIPGHDLLLHGTMPGEALLIPAVRRSRVARPGCGTVAPNRGRRVPPADRLAFPPYAAASPDRGPP